MARGKRYRELETKVDRKKLYDATEAVSLVRELATAKFDETVAAHFRLGVDPRKSEQNVRGTVALPHGTGRTVRVLAFVDGENVAAAEAAGADHVGGEELIDRVAGGWFDFDAVVATPQMMAAVGSKLGRILGPRACRPTRVPAPAGRVVDRTSRASKPGRTSFRPKTPARFTHRSAKTAYQPGNRRS